jgi:hypothetical protein
MIPDNITKEHILQALAEIDQTKNIPLYRLSDVYELLFDGKTYPPKYIISIANKYANNELLIGRDFTAGETKKFLKKMGFDVIPKIVESSGDSIIIASIGRSDIGWKGYEEKDISLSYVPREAWNFYDFNDQEYFGFISDTSPKRFTDGGLVLLTSIDRTTKKRIFLGFYGNTKIGTFALPVDISDTISNKEIQQQFKQKFSDDLTVLQSRQLLAEKSLSTCFQTPVEFELNEIGVKNWTQAAFMYVGEGNPISKENSQKLVLKALKVQQELLSLAVESDKEKISSDINKIQIILDQYFGDTHDSRAYWVVLPLSEKFDRLEVWRKWKSFATVNIMWSKLAEKLGNRLLNFSSYKEYETEYRQIYPDTQADMIWKFIYEMKEGDLIVVSRGLKTILGRGIVKSPAKIYNKSTEDSPEYQDFFSDLPIHRDVLWEEFSPEVPIPQEIKRQFSRGVNLLTKSEYDLIFDETSDQAKRMPAIEYPKKQVILYGPPGTGKTYNTIIRAHEIIFGINDPNVTYRTLQDKLNTQQKSEIDVSQLNWIEAIILSFKEIQKEKVQVDDIKNSKIIKNFILNTKNNNIRSSICDYLSKGSRLNSETVKIISKTGREYFDKDSESNWYLTEKGKDYLKTLLEDLKDAPSTSSSQFSFVTFHQSFSYEDFVEGIRPKISDDENYQMSYRIKPGIFKEICKKAELDPENNYVLVIDEINRGNISKIFGELITLLEDNKRKGEKEEITVKLPYSGDDFCVPNNVYIIGTMNSTDKSIALVDIALRRRFHFERLNVNYDLIPNEDAKKFLRELNHIICAIKNSDYEIGHYYFMTIPQEDGGNKELKSVFSNRILPLLEEYFFNDWEALATILGPESIQIDRRKKLIWDEDSGEFKKDTGDYDKIFGRCIQPADKVFEITMKHLGIRTQNPDVQE